MPINRAPFNALVDDDGSNTVGSVWNKAAIKTVLLDPIDALHMVVQRTAATGTQHDFGLGVPGADTLLVCVNTSLLSLDGIAGGVDGQLVRIVAASGPVALVHYAGSAAANRFYNFALSAATVLAPLGTATYQYDVSSQLWRLVAHEQGPGITVPYLAGNFTAAGGTWTVPAGQVLTNRYTVRGTTLVWTVYLGATTIGGTTTQLLITIPGGFLAAAQWSGVQRGAQINDAGGAVEAMVGPATAGASTIAIQKNNNAAWVAGTAPAMLFSLALEIQ